MPSHVKTYHVQGRHVMEHLIDHDHRLVSVRPIAVCCGESDAQEIVDALRYRDVSVAFHRGDLGNG